MEKAPAPDDEDRRWKQCGDLCSRINGAAVWGVGGKYCTAYACDDEVGDGEAVSLQADYIRHFTFGIAVALAAATIGMMESEWIAYGIYIFFLVGFCRVVGMYATVSVNAVIGTHFLQSGDFSYAFIWNEFLLVCIGITAALILNLFYDYGTQKKNLIRNQRETEKRLQLIMAELAAYMSGKRMQINVWERIHELEADLEAFIRDAYEYQDNTFHSHPG